MHAIIPRSERSVSQEITRLDELSLPLPLASSQSIAMDCETPAAYEVLRDKLLENTMTSLRFWNGLLGIRSYFIRDEILDEILPAHNLSHAEPGVQFSRKRSVHKQLQ